MAFIGYARVSARDQDLNSQVDALVSAGVPAKSIFQEKASGKDRGGRPALAQALSKITKGDTLVVTRLDRLARSSLDLLNIVHEIEVAGGTFKSLSDAWADTTTPHGRLIMAVLGGLAEFERALINERTKLGRERAMARGVRFGRPVKLTKFQIDQVLQRLDADESVCDIARSLNVHHSMISRLSTGHRKPIQRVS